jgi:hypothetical protein
MEKGSNKTFVLVVLVILAASMLSAQLSSEDPSGMLARQTIQRQATATKTIFGQCYDGLNDVTPYKTTLTNCCGTKSTVVGLPNYKWVNQKATVYC